MGKVVEPSVFNSKPVRVGVILATVALAFAQAAALPATAGLFVHLLAASVWLGVNVWVTFIAGIVMFKNMQRQAFGRLQSKLFPLYFGLISVCCAALFGTIYFGALGGIAPPRVMHTLLLGLATAASNLLFIEPAATKVLFQRYDLENSGSTDADLRKKLTKQFGALHGLSSLANLGNLAAAVAHVAWIAMVLRGAI